MLKLFSKWKSHLVTASLQEFTENQKSFNHYSITFGNRLNKKNHNRIIWSLIALFTIFSIIAWNLTGMLEGILIWFITIAPLILISMHIDKKEFESLKCPICLKKLKYYRNMDNNWTLDCNTCKLYSETGYFGIHFHSNTKGI